MKAAADPNASTARDRGEWAVPFMRPDLPAFASVAPGIEAIMRGGTLTKGEELRLLEQEARAVVGTEHVVGVSSCTTGLMLVMRSPRRGDRSQFHLPRRSGRHRLGGAAAGVRRRRSGHVHGRSVGGRRGGHAAHRGRPRLPHVRVPV